MFLLQIEKRSMVKQRFVFGLFVVVLLLVLAACSRSGDTPGSGSSTGPHEVQVTLTEYKVSSSMTNFTVGSAYHFVVTNNGNTAHEFMVTQPMAMGNMSMDQMHKMAYTYIDTINPRETKSVDYTFPSSATGKSIELACHLPGHYEAGMKLPVTVST